MALEMQNYVRRMQTREGSKRFAVTLSPAAMAVVGLGLLIILGWCFYMGFMIGRGQNPEEHLQRMAAILQPADEQKAAQPGAAPAPEGQPAEAAAQDGQPAQQQAQAAGQPAPFVPGNVPGYPTFQQGQPAQAAQAAKPAAQPKEQAKQATRPAQAQAPYTFVYRMATVRSREDARSEQARYENKGFRTSIRAYGKSWALLHTFKGTDRDCEQFLADVKKAGLGAPARVSKKKN